MASISLLLLGFFAVLGGLVYFHRQLKSFTGIVVVFVIALLGLYIGVTLADVILSNLGFETGFPDPESGYYLYQSVIYIVVGLAMLGSHYYLLKGISSKEISHAFWWVGVVLLITGGLDLLIETFIRIPALEVKLLVAILLLIGMVIVVSRYRDRIFGKREAPKIPAKGEA